jgi:RNA polymerase sigma-70 factor (ECF subfamily)
MDNKSGYIQLVQQAQLGNEESLNALAELAGKRLRVYVYRLTLQDELTQEIVQESMLEMCRILGKLKKADRFWPWLYGIANNKLRRHHRTEHTRRKAATSQAKNGDTQKDRQEGFENLVSQELKQIISAAMQNLKTRHRAVLIMRCYDGMSYSEIAESMGCSEFSTRMLFLRAKKSLQKQLSRSGFGRGTLLTALVLFGKMTVPSEAAAANISVTAATTKVGLVAGLVGMATSKSAVVTITTAGALAVGSIVVTSGPEKTTVEAGQKPVINSQIVSPIGHAQNDSEEHWYYFPEGPDKSMMMRLKSNVGGKQSYCQLLQNNRGNYYYHENTIYINNYRMTTSDLGVYRLPTDSPQLSRFLSQVEGHSGQIKYVPNKDRGMLVLAKRCSDHGDKIWRIDRHFNVLEEEYFQFDWPESAKIVDNRDTMHKRGWTYFRITGRINAEEVSGTGRIPFVYAASMRFSPWLKLQLADGSMIVDNGVEACVFDGSGKVAARYEGGSFFKGLGRPWMGLHTIDTVRRDAAEKQVWFETKRSNKAEVVLTREQVKLVYTIDMETDVIEKITFSVSNSGESELRFSYLQNIDNVGNEFVSPRRRSSTGSQRDRLGMLWLVKLAEGGW